MKFLSLFSGIEAASVAWKPLGFECIGLSEIDNNASKLLKYHYPDIPNFGNILDFNNWPDISPDLIVGGSPCQSFSYAGQRKGLDDARGQLTLTYTKIIKKYRPRWIVWENVPGVLSADGGRVFGQLTSTLVRLGYGLAWRILDTQYTRTPSFPCAIPQRRRRLLLVGCYGDWNNATRVLFDEESFAGLPKPSRKRQFQNSSGIEGNFDEDSTIVNFNINTGANHYFSYKTNHCDTITTRSDGYVICKLSNTKANGSPISINGSTFTIDSGGGSSQSVFHKDFIRKLTPKECERLQGLPDGYTDVCGLKKTARYKLIGNSMSINVMEWIGIRLKEVEND